MTVENWTERAKQYLAGQCTETDLSNVAHEALAADPCADATLLRVVNLLAAHERGLSEEDLRSSLQELTND